MQRHSDNTVIVGCIKDGQEGEYRSLVKDFMMWCRFNHLQLNASKTKEMVVDFRRKKPHLQPVSIEEADVDVVRTYKYLGLQLDDKLDWTANMGTLHRKGQSLYFLRRLGSSTSAKQNKTKQKCCRCLTSLWWPASSFILWFDQAEVCSLTDCCPSPAPPTDSKTLSPPGHQTVQQLSVRAERTIDNN